MQEKQRKNSVCVNEASALSAEVELYKIIYIDMFVFLMKRTENKEPPEHANLTVQREIQNSTSGCILSLKLTSVSRLSRSPPLNMASK